MESRVNNMNLLEMKHVKKKFDNLEVLKDISIEVKEGEVVAIIGPSGSGKSTFLRCLNLLEVPTEGEILIEGESITAPKTNVNKIREKMGMVFQQFNLFPHLTVLDNITLAPIKVKKMPGVARQPAFFILVYNLILFEIKCFMS